MTTSLRCVLHCARPASRERRATAGVAAARDEGECLACAAAALRSQQRPPRTASAFHAEASRLPAMLDRASWRAALPRRKRRVPTPTLVTLPSRPPRASSRARSDRSTSAVTSSSPAQTRALRHALLRARCGTVQVEPRPPSSDASSRFAHEQSRRSVVTESTVRCSNDRHSTTVTYTLVTRNRVDPVVISS